MVDIRNGIFMKDVEYIDVHGKPQIISLKPLKSKYIPKMFKVLQAMKGMIKEEGKEPSSDEVLSMLDEEIVEILITLTKATLERSLPEGTDKDDIDTFASLHFLKLFPEIISLNMGNMKG